MSLIRSRQQFDDLKTRLQEEPLIAFDTETTFTNLQEERQLLGLSISVPKYRESSTQTKSPSPTTSVHSAGWLQAKYDSWYFPVGHLESPLSPTWNQPIEWLQELPWSDPKKAWIAHNAKFDIEVMKPHVGTIRGVVYCTQVMAHAVNENFKSYELDYLGNILLKVRKLKDTKTVRKDFEKIDLTWSHIPANIMGDYAERDTEITFELFRYFYKPWMSLRKDFRREALNFVRTLGDVITRGLMVDAEALEAHSTRSGARMEALCDQLGGKPTDTWTRHELYEKGGLPVIDTTPAGAPAIDKDTLARLSLEFPEWRERLEMITEYRTEQKAKSTWYDGWREYVGSDSRIHPGFKQHGTETGRLSCAKPSTHQIPRDATKYAVKSCIRAPEGYAYVGFDYNAIELREASQLAYVHVGDSRMFDLLKSGADAHHASAELIGSYDYFPVEQRKEGRQVGKRWNFGSIYGASAQRLREALWGDARMDIPLNTCQEWTNAWHAHYWGFRAVSNRIAETCHERGYARTWNGRRRRYPRSLDVGLFKDSLNFMCQGGGGQCLIVAMNKLNRMGYLIVNCVHDSIEMYLPLDKLEEQTSEVCSIMSEVAESAFPGMTFPVDATIYWPTLQAS